MIESVILWSLPKNHTFLITLLITLLNVWSHIRSVIKSVIKCDSWNHTLITLLKCDHTCAWSHIYFCMGYPVNAVYFKYTYSLLNKEEKTFSARSILKVYFRIVLQMYHNSCSIFEVYWLYTRKTFSARSILKVYFQNCTSSILQLM